MRQVFKRGMVWLFATFIVTDVFIITILSGSSAVMSKQEQYIMAAVAFVTIGLVFGYAWYEYESDRKRRDMLDPEDGEGCE